MEQMEPARAELGMDLIRDHLCRLFLDELMWSEHERLVFNFQLGGALVPEHQRGYEYWFSSDLQAISVTNHGHTRLSEAFAGWDGIGVTQFGGLPVDTLEAYQGMSDEQIVYLNGAPLDQAQAMDLATLLAVCVRHAQAAATGVEFYAGRDVNVVPVDDELL